MHFLPNPKGICEGSGNWLLVSPSTVLLYKPPSRDIDVVIIVKLSFVIDAYGDVVILVVNFFLLHELGNTYPSPPLVMVIQTPPPPLPFRSKQVNSYKPTKHPKAWVRPPPPLPSNRDEEAPTLPVPPPFITRCVNAAPPDYVIDDSSIRNGNGTGEKKEAQIGGREKNRAAKHPQTPQTGSIHYDQLALPEECNTSDLIDANSRRALATSGGVEPCRPADNSSKVPYTYMDTNCFTPRRRRKSSSNNRRTTTTSTAISHLRTERRQEEIIGMRVENRLHELGATLQRRRNNMPKDPSVAQRERQEQKELLECTFKPMSFTKTYGKTQKRGKRVSRVSEQ